MLVGHQHQQLMDNLQDYKRRVRVVENSNITRNLCEKFAKNRNFDPLVAENWYQFAPDMFNDEVSFILLSPFSSSLFSLLSYFLLFFSIISFSSLSLSLFFFFFRYPSSPCLLFIFNNRVMIICTKKFSFHF